MIKLVPIDDVHASDYNPRKNDEKRLGITELSLRKLGFVLPIFADLSGEILSGHQRHIVAKRLGFTKIPVVYVKVDDPNIRKALNILFNRATNDLTQTDTTDNMKTRLYGVNIQSLSGALPDIESDTKESFPCVYRAKRMDVMILARHNNKKFDSNTYALQRSLEKNTKGSMPIIITPNLEVVNGIGRLQCAAADGKKVVSCVEVPETHKEFAYSVLNLLSMDFSMESQFADTLRYNSFRQAMINTVYDRLIPGGAFIFVEKVVGGAQMDDVFVDLYYQMKNLNGYSYEKIMNKKKSLENVLSPLKAEWNADMLRTAGFGNIDMFWRCLNFCGFVAVK